MFQNIKTGGIYRHQLAVNCPPASVLRFVISGTSLHRHAGGGGKLTEKDTNITSYMAHHAKHIKANVAPIVLCVQLREVSCQPFYFKRIQLYRN